MQRKLRAFFSTMGWMLVGAVIGGVVAEPVGQASRTAIERVCGVESHLSEGNAARRQAVDLELRHRRITARGMELHRIANAAFEKARACGSARATLDLGTAYCRGWAVDIDRAKGWRLIEEAGRADSSVVMLVLRRPGVCPDVDGQK